MADKISRRGLFRRGIRGALELGKHVSPVIALAGCGVQHIKGELVLDKNYCAEDVTATVNGVDPFEHFHARSWTENWYINWNVKYGNYEDPTDFDAALASIGLGSDDKLTRRLARAAVQRLALGLTSETFLNNYDGGPNVFGLPISFQRPCDIEALANPENTICVRYADDYLAYGRSYTDHGNQVPNHTCGNSREEILGFKLSENPVGVFVNELAEDIWQGVGSYAAELKKNPLSKKDNQFLVHILTHDPREISPQIEDQHEAARYRTIKNLIFDISNDLRRTISHEIGHGLGLEHVEEVGIMGPIGYSFSDESLAILGENLS